MVAAKPTRIRVALVMPDDLSLWQPRRGLISMLVEQGYDVTTVSEPGPFVKRIEQLGARHIPIPLSRSFNLSGDLRYLWRLFRILRRGKFDIVSVMTTKPNVYGIPVARLAGTPWVVGSVEGLGQGFSDTRTPTARTLRYFLTTLYWVAGHLSDGMRFFNPDDERYFLQRRLISKEKAVLIVGEGLNVEEYQPVDPRCEAVVRVRRQFAGDEGKVLVVMVARANRFKGVREFIEASKIVTRTRDNVQFIHVGGLDEGPGAIPREELEASASRVFKWVGFWPDLKEVYAAADMIVSPSLLREGLPSILCEAMAMGKPTVTTDNVGCRETVDPGETGFLVPPGDIEALAEAIGKLVDDQELRERLGRGARQKVLRDFDERKQVQRVIDELYRARSAGILSRDPP